VCSCMCAYGRTGSWRGEPYRDASMGLVMVRWGGKGEPDMVEGTAKEGLL
jgi:hypothetical protein